MAHDQPTYASVPGIRVFGMMCVKPTSFGTTFVRRPQSPLPPKRNQQFQTQSSYYQRYKKHATVGPSVSTKLDAEFTTRGLENREGDDIELSASNEETAATMTTTFDSSSMTTDSTTLMYDSNEENESTVDDNDAEVTTIDDDDDGTTENRRIRRMISDSSDRFSHDDNDEYDSSRRQSRRSTNDWPDIPWDEVREQMKNIQWD